MDDVDHQDNHRHGTSPLAHHPVTRVSVSGPVRFPWGLRRSRRDEERTRWAAAVATHVPAWQLPPATQARNRRQQPGDPVWLQAPECRARHERFRTTIALAIALGEEASRGNGPGGVVVGEAWYLAEAVVWVLARRRQDWGRLRHRNRGLATASVQRRAVTGGAMPLPGPHLAVEALVPRIPANASRAVAVGGPPSWGFTLRGRLPSWGQGRSGGSCAEEALTGRSVGLVTNRVDWSAAKLSSLSLHRWPTETLYQASPGPLGCNAYRRRSTEALGTPWCVVCVASALRHWTCLPRGPDRTQGLMHIMGDACRPPGRAWRHKLLIFAHDQWSDGVKADQLLAQ